MKLGDYINVHRVNAGMTQKELAARCEMNVKRIRRYETNEVSPRFNDLVKIAKAMGVDKIN